MAKGAKRRLKAERQGWEVPSPVGKATEVCGRVEAHGAIALADRDEQSMLVDQVKVVDKPDELALAAQVRLKVAERLLQLLGRSRTSVPSPRTGARRAWERGRDGRSETSFPRWAPARPSPIHGGG